MILKPIKTVLLFALLGLLLSGCRTEEIDVSEVETSIDTTDWPRHCLGYHSFIIPPEMEEGGISATASVDFQEIIVLKNYTGTPRSAIESQDDYAGVVFEVEVNDWLVLVTRENLGLIISDITYMVYGVRRVGADVVMTRQNVSIELVGERGDEPKLWEYHARTTPMLLADWGGREGYCFKGLFFESGPPKYRAVFRATAGELEPLGSGGGRLLLTSNNIYISFSIEPNVDLTGTRPLAPQDDISNLPEVTVKSESIRVLGDAGGLSTVVYESEDEKALWYNVTIYGEEMSTSDPWVSIKYTNYVDSPEDSREKIMAILAGFKRN